MMSSTFKILFYLRKNHVNKHGKSAIMVRVTVNGERCAFSSKLEIDPEIWDTKLGGIRGRNHVAIEINNRLEDMSSSIRNLFYKIEREDGYVTAEKIKNSFLGHTIKQQSLIGLFQQHNDEFKKLVGVSKSKDTYEKYIRTCSRIEDFVKSKYNLSDIPLREVNHKFITDLEAYLRVDCRYQENTAAKYMQRFRHIIIIAKNYGWVLTDPFVNYQIRFKKVDRGFLIDEELERIMKKEFSTIRLEQVRDIFIFSCFTGLAYIDVKNLTKDNIRQSFDGSLWIMTKRQKTDTPVNVPLLTIPKLIIEKYKGKLKDNILLPVLSNQKTNSYLKEIADVCGINKNLTFHLARSFLCRLPSSTGSRCLWFWLARCLPTHH
ncbi:MAG: site-specific integrase [Bacteroidales bacterium]